VDPTGLPRVRLDWRWTDPEQERLDRLRREVARWFEDSGWGKVSFAAGRPPDFNAHHHAGTTRMHPDPAGGVVDADLRVHGTENLYLTGASVFPSSGWANPTLTIVALSLRLADYLRQTA
jgi:choline dehydrogenase-like flavoprotein